MKFIICIALLFVLGGCSMFKNTKTDTDHDQLVVTQKEDAALQVQKNWLRDTDSFTFYADSANRNYAVQLWPKGAFTYSPERGFAGEAEKISIVGHSNEVETGGGHEYTHEADLGSLNAQSSTNNKLEADHLKKTEESAVSWKWVLAGLLVLGVLISYLFYKNSH